MTEALAEVIHAARFSWVGGGDGDFDAHLADAVCSWLEAKASEEQVRAAVANAVPLGFTERDPYPDTFQAGDAVVAAFLGALSDGDEETQG